MARFISKILDSNGDWVDSIRAGSIEECANLSKALILEARALPREPYYPEGYEPYVYYLVHAAHLVLDTPIGEPLARND